MSSYKILRVVYDWPPPWDGLASAPYELSKAQIALGNKVIALAGGLGGSKLLKLNFRKVENGKGPVVYYLPRALYKFGPFFSTSLFVLPYYFVLKLLRRVDVVHGHGHIMLWFNLYRRLFGWLDKTPYISHMHITAAGRENLLRKRGYNLDFFTRFIEYPLHELSDRVAVEVSDYCIFVSKDLISEAEKFYGADRNKCFLVESGVNTDLFRPNPKVKREREILFVGMIDSRKNPNLIIEALKYLPSYKATFVGRGSSEYIEELKDLAVKLKVLNRIRFTGYVPYNDLLPYYRKAAVFVLPSLYEGFPKVVLEALACGTPVIASGFDVESPISGLCIESALTPRRLADRIVRFEKERVEVNVKFIEDYYSWNSRAVEIQRIYDKAFKK